MLWAAGFIIEVVTIRPLVAVNGLERTGHDLKPSRSLVLKLGLILSALKTRTKDNDGTEPICRFPPGYGVWHGNVSIDVLVTICGCNRV